MQHTGERTGSLPGTFQDFTNREGEEGTCPPATRGR